jgi:hypothetical protein
MARTAIEVNYDDYVWEIDASPEETIAKIESAKIEGRKFVELYDDKASGSRIWLSVDNIMAVYDWRDEEEEGDQEVEEDDHRRGR